VKNSEIFSESNKNPHESSTIPPLYSMVKLSILNLSEGEKLMS
jgi:hypothetical protein